MARACYCPSAINELGHAWTTTYDVLNRRITETGPLNRTTTYGYGIGIGGCSPCHSESKVAEIINPSGKVTRITYNGEWQKLSETTGFGTPEAATISYTYNTVGNLVSTSDPRGKVRIFTYENRHRRITATDPLGHITRWTYDAAGNNLTETRLDGGVTTNTYDVMNRLLTTRNPNNETTTFAYGGTGAAGNQGDNLITLTDARGNSYAFTYDAKNRSIARAINATTTLSILDDWNLIDERNPADTQQAKHIHGPAIDEMLVRTTPTGTAYYQHDGLGSTTALTNATGARLESYRYDVFDQAEVRHATGTAVPSSPTSSRFLFTGREYLVELNLYDYRNRVYQAELGRFLQTDPIRFSTGDKNKYRYVTNSTTLQTDPFGLWASASGNHHNPCLVCNDGETKTGSVIAICGIQLGLIRLRPFPMSSYKNCGQDYICSGGDRHPKGAPHTCGKCGEGGLIPGNPSFF
jgi:RHS repeat-associated protein